MIGVLTRPEQALAVEEFFELFKTPWEFYREGRGYDVVLDTTQRESRVDAKLVVSYGSVSTGVDAGYSLEVDGFREGSTLRYQDTALPLYSQLATFNDASSGSAVLFDDNGRIAAVECSTGQGKTIRVGFDLFDEVTQLLSNGQPASNADVPTLDLHIAILREWIVQAGVSLVEVLPRPGGHEFAVCLTHDIDFIGIRGHIFDHSMRGFLFRSTFGAVRDLARGRISIVRAIRMWRAVAGLPLVIAGWAKDFWEPFEWYLRVEQNLPATYFLIPFKRRMGERVSSKHASRRATAYDVSDLAQVTAKLKEAGCEVGVHGIDAWHSVERGVEEKARVASTAGEQPAGIRMHWLLRNEHTASVLEQAGFAYDSTEGYNDAIGYRNGTGQVFRPLGAHSLLELPLHIQDGALFYRQQMDLSEPEAETRCQSLVENAKRFGGVLTVLWHDRSHGPERFWGEFYVSLLKRLRSSSCWFGTAAQVVGWFRKRRAVRFQTVSTSCGFQTTLHYDGEAIIPPLVIRRYEDRAPVDVMWNGEPSELSRSLMI